MESETIRGVGLLGSIVIILFFVFSRIYGFEPTLISFGCVGIILTVIIGLIRFWEYIGDKFGD